MITVVLLPCYDIMTVLCYFLFIILNGFECVLDKLENMYIIPFNINASKLEL